MNADRMIAVFLSGVLVGGLVVYMAPNNGLSSGMSGGHQGAQTGAGGQGGGGPAGGQASSAAQAATPSGDVGSSSGAGGGAATAGGGAAASGGLGASTETSGSGPGAQGSMESSAMGGTSGGVMNTTGGQSGGQGGTMGGTDGGDSSSPISPVPVSGAPQGATRLLRHLQIAPTLWKAQAEAALQSKDAKIRALAGDIAAHAAAVPTVTDRLPQTPNVVSYLVDSKLLLDRMKSAGMDVGSLETQVDEVSRARK